jgi:hypothetical protein
MSYTYPVYVIGKQNYKSFLTHIRRHIFVTMLGITWTERWLGYELAS